MTTPEGRVVNAIKAAVRRYGGQYRKVRWEGRAGAPDLFIMINGYGFFIEAKAPGRKPRPHQLREHELMRIHGGQSILIVDSCEMAKDCIGRVAGGTPPEVLEYEQLTHRSGRNE